MKLFKTAAPGIILDELQRVASGNQNGNMVDALIQMTEAESSKRWLDPWVAAPVDISGVLWLGTVNEMGNLPPALRDRFRIIRFPEAGPEHLLALGNSIVQRTMHARGLDDRWIERLDEDEEDALAEHWPGGSIRKLTRLVEGVLKARDGRPMN